MLQNESFFTSFLQIAPPEALEIPAHDLVALLKDQFGASWEVAVDPEKSIPSPLNTNDSPVWIQKAKCVGINVRTIDHFWNIIPYALTLPKSQNAIHILPIWEPGVVGSLYGMSSWKINPEFFSEELRQVYPHLDTVEKQLKVVVNILHLFGKAVGMDVVPHTDRFAEQVLANPVCFEWLQRSGLSIIKHHDLLYQEVENHIFYCFQQMGNAALEIEPPATAGDFFYKTTEEDRCRMLFGQPDDYWGRLERRKMIIHWLFQLGLETAPATMAPPYRGLEVDPDEKAMVVDEDGRTWRDYRMTKPEAMSRVFGPLTRYRLYESKNENKDWELDFGRPATGVWTYVCQHYHDIQRTYNFDFMRGDMSHVQMRPDGVPEQPDGYYDLLAAVKTAVLKETPWFGYFAESFMAPPGEMAYGDESDHLEAALAETTLGDLQSEPVGTDFFVQEFARYRHILETRKFAPNFTILTADKDDPRFDQFYLTGNEIRYFVALFLADMPSYMALGFECRDPHPVPVANEFYTKLYVFQEKKGPKRTTGPYQWGKNLGLCQRLNRQKYFSNQIVEEIQDAEVTWVIAPDSTGKNKTIAWKTSSYLFYANFDTQADSPTMETPAGYTPVFSTHEKSIDYQRVRNDFFGLLPGEGLIFKAT